MDEHFKWMREAMENLSKTQGSKAEEAAKFNPIESRDKAPQFKHVELKEKATSTMSKEIKEEKELRKQKEREFLFETYWKKLGEDEMKEERSLQGKERAEASKAKTKDKKDWRKQLDELLLSPVLVDFFFTSYMPLNSWLDVISL
ncbi:hypothetical protein U1Q18_005384 [Sarracenia purpurea var. burkii]